MNIYVFSFKTGIPSLIEIEDQSAPNRDDLSRVSSNPVYWPKVGSEITSGKTTLTTDKESYAPGEWATITAESTTDEMNGSLEWQLESPIGEIAFNFSSDFQDVFEDRFFNNPAIPDWTNDGFYSIEATSGYLNLTEVADDDKDDVEVFYNTSMLNPDRYVISFDYFSQGQNLLLNPGFEGGDTTGWFFNSSYVQPVDDSENASEGSYYLNINGTEGNLLEQNVSIVGGNIKRNFLFSIKATGATNDNFWQLELLAYNSSFDEIGSFPTPDDSRDFTADEKGYITTTLMWEIPENTTMLGLRFKGQDSGNDDRYTGWVDDCYLYEVPPALIFSYWDENNEWNNKTLDTGTHEWEYSSDPSDMEQNLSKTFRFILPDDNSFSNNVTSYWLIDNMAVNLVTDSVPDIELDPIINNLYSKSGNINSTWFHQDVRENLTSTFDIQVEAPENSTVPSECQATIRVQLPIRQLYFGSWIFVYKIHRIEQGTWDPLDTKTINISFIVKEPMNYVVQDIYMLRGSENVTQNNESVIINYFEQETNIQAISPGDNVTLLGFLEANSTRGEWYDLEYLKEGLNLDSVEFVWNSNWQSRMNLTWGVQNFIPYDKEGENILKGNFDSPYDNTSTLAINFRVSPPGEIRGIFGNLSANLTITLTGNNVKSGDIDYVGGGPLVLTMPVNLPPVKFKINATKENLPATSYYLNDYIGGNITLEFLNYNDTLETTFPNRTISSKLPIPMTDLELTIFLDNLNQTPNEKDISLQFHYNYIGKTILWLDLVNARLLSGTYAFRIRWNTPYKLGLYNQEELILPHFIKIKGSLMVIPAEDFPEIKQGGHKTINFSVHLDNETGKEIGGLDLLGIVSGNQTYGNLIIYEEDNVYKIDLDIDPKLEANDYTIEISIIGRTDVIGEISYRVTEDIPMSEDALNLIEVVINIGGFAFFILAGVGTIFALYLVNKKLK
jgi:hypothetical protein